jgi:hypothetical protein
MFEQNEECEVQDRRPCSPWVRRSHLSQLSNNIIQKGLAFVRDWSGTVVSSEGRGASEIRAGAIASENPDPPFSLSFVCPASAGRPPRGVGSGAGRAPQTERRNS